MNECLKQNNYEIQKNLGFHMYSLITFLAMFVLLISLEVKYVSILFSSLQWMIIDSNVAV